MAQYITTFEIDHIKILASPMYESYGDEDFDIFNCPICKKIYLIDYEVDSIFLDPENLSEIFNGDVFLCSFCGFDFTGEVIIGAAADEKYKVTLEHLMQSDWKWILK
ncbi:hypothetical protein [Pseudomonas putida]|uniref:hypothetical protein n=1 Tax=Pseudomonas putida TaxID=303 RepID=UPI0023666196|nr:hypothetical protein [Pseudomonas putida]MDD2047197.1 hypothetical protein [Pseudomonas putida]